MTKSEWRWTLAYFTLAVLVVIRICSPKNIQMSPCWQRVWSIYYACPKGQMAWEPKTIWDCVMYETGDSLQQCIADANYAQQAEADSWLLNSK